jgi:hypothetical protein
MQLTPAHIGGKNTLRAALQKNLCKTARGRAYVEADAAVRAEPERIESRAELPGASRNISFGFKDLQALIRADFQARLEHGPPGEANRPAPD